MPAVTRPSSSRALEAAGDHPGLDRKFYEICALSELKNALRSGDIWVKRARGSSATSTTTCCRRESSPHSARANTCPGDQPGAATSTEERFAAAGQRTVGHRHPRTAKDNEHAMPSLTVRAENHPGCGGAGSNAGADRPNQPDYCRASRSPNC